jgi:hypothetical protein
MRIIIILIMVILASTPLRVEPLSFEQRWEPVRQIPQPRELTFEERWAPVRQLPQMLDFSTMPPPEPKNQTAQVDSSLFDPKPILSKEQDDNLSSVPVRIIRVRAEQKPVPAFMLDSKPAALDLYDKGGPWDPDVPIKDDVWIKNLPVRIIVPAIVPPPPEPKPVKPRQVASIRYQPGDICTRHGMHKEVTRGGKSWRCRK